jgi:aromatic ring-opening dioxygenase catalytic subunit (LigB family)
MSRLPTYFISHGGGPWPYMQGEFRRHFDHLEQSLEGIAKEVGDRAKVVLMVSGHWEADRFTLMAAERPGMVYDYSGFPPHTYEVRYPAPGSPALAERAKTLLEDAGIAAALDPTRGFDHGTFAPLAIMYPDARLPVVQLSLRQGYDPEQHLAAGRALAPLRDEGVLIVGSGLSYHNLRLFGPAAREPSAAFDGWLYQVLEATPAARSEGLRSWSRAPAARIAHPREDHLIPLMVAVGAAENEAAERVYYEREFMGGVTASSYRFGMVQ